MSSRTLYRLSGGTLIAAGLLILIGSVLGAVLFPGQSSTPQQFLSFSWLFVTWMTLIGSLLFVIGLPGMYLRQAGHAGVLGFVGFILLFFAILLQGAGSTMQVIVFPFLAQVAPKLTGNNSGPTGMFLALIVFALMVIIGAILLGIATIRARVFPRWTGILLLIAGIIFLLSIPPLPSPIGDFLAVASYIVLFAPFLEFGYALIAGEYGTVEAAPMAAEAQMSR